MKRTTLLLLLAAAALLFSSCIFIDVDEFERFHYSLQGTWETQPESYQNVKVEIDHDTIRITGAYWGNPLSSFTQNSRLEGYSSETENSWDVKKGTIHIKDRGSWQTAEYVYWVDKDQKKYLILGSGSPTLVLR